jgi:RNA polymerase sigma-70 factor (ECF subfamily)
VLDVFPASGVGLAADAADAELLALIAAGDSGAPLRRLYGRYERRLYGFGLRLLGEPGLAEELVQETWVRLWQSAPRFDPQRGTVRAFLFTIARRVAADLWRRPSSRSLGAEREDAASVEAAADDVLLAVTVRDAMESLSPAHREVLELVYDEDLKLADIADRLGVPLGTVKTRAHHALRGLRRALEERGWDG